jgi:hypothetical protein
MSRVSALVSLLAMAGALAGCNRYVPFLVTGQEQENFNNNADIVFVVDNSDSMQPVAEDLALNVNTFISTLTSEEASNVPRETLSDATSNFIREVSGDTLLIDYQLAVTTSSIEYDNGVGPTDGIDPGEAGTLVAPVIDRNDDDPAIAFQKAVLCGATCIDENDVPTDPAYVCTENPQPGDQVTSDYLDCLCGPGEWTGHCGSGNEMQIEAAYIAMCRATEGVPVGGSLEVPDSCYSYLDPIGSAEKPTVFQPGDEHSNDGMLREPTEEDEGAQTVIVIITDEGDGSYRLATGDTDVDLYVDLFNEFQQPVRLAVVGPAYHDGDLGCNSGGAQPWAVERMQNLVAELHGVYIDIEAPDENGDCAYTDFGTNLEQIGQLLSSLLTIFPLQSVPDVSTIDVYVDGEQVDAAPVVSGTPEAGDIVYGDGWYYDPAENAIGFSGAAVPPYNADVKIYYRPIGGTPRDLPPGF